MEIIVVGILIFFLKDMFKGYGFNLEKKQAELLNNYIDTTLSKYNKSNRILDGKSFRKKMIMYIILFIITIIDISYYFIYHRNIFIPIIVEIIALYVTFKFTRKFNIRKEIEKQIKASPDDNMEYIIASIINDATSKLYIASKLVILGMFIISVSIPFVFFNNPHIIYEKDGEGYAVRFYTLGISKQEKNIVIPATYNGKPVIGIRGNVFQNLDYIESVELPDTITYIRGHAFENTGITSINLSNSLKLIGGYAFANTKLKELIIPDSVTEVGGGVCKSCFSLTTLKLSKNATEIRGNSYQYTRITEVYIPDGVTRIGGHAFHGCPSLENVYIPDTVTEIGSSAFRDCYKLTSVTVPQGAFINERAFKNSPTSIQYK